MSRSDSTARIAFVELPARDVTSAKAFYSAAFGWDLIAGGTVSKPVFGFPGGRRFHFIDPNGLELAVMQAD